MTHPPRATAPGDAAPRVRITYAVETGGGMEQRALPFVIVVLADLDADAGPGAGRLPLKKRPPLAIDPAAVDAALAGHRPSAATRRGLAHLAAQVRHDPNVQLKVLNAAPHELRADARQQGALEYTAIFKHLYENCHGTFGGEPIGLLVGDFALSGSDDNMALLEHLAALAARLHAPLVAAASPALLGLGGFADLPPPQDLRRAAAGLDTARWRAFRDSEDARSVTLTLPRALLRSAAQADAVACNAAYVLAARIAGAVARTGWPAAFSAFEDDGAAPEVDVDPDRAQALAALGFTPLCSHPGTAATGFVGLQTTQRPLRLPDGEARSEAPTAATLAHLLAVSRFAHYVAVIARKKIGSFLTRANLEAFLATWLTQYVLLDDAAPAAAQAAYPLRAAQAVVTEVPGALGSYRATLFLQPRYQLEPLAASIRLVVDLPG